MTYGNFTAQSEHSGLRVNKKNCFDHNEGQKFREEWKRL